MTRVGKFAFGVLTILVLGGVTVCGQSQSKRAEQKTVSATILIDRQATVTYEGGKLSVVPFIAVIEKATEFSWSLSSLPDGYTVEIDFRVQGDRKGPFVRPSGGQTGRYVGKGGQVIEAGRVEVQKRDVHKYDVIVRDATGKDVAAVDPMMIEVEP